MSLEIKVLEKEIGKLSINYEELKKELTETLSVLSKVTMVEDITGYAIFNTIDNGKYEYIECADGNFIITADNAKKLRSTLNKAEKAINDRKIELKKEIMKPYELVETQAKELINLIKDVSDSIDEQIKAKEQREKDIKLKFLQEIWVEKNYQKLTFDEIFSAKWLNKSMSNSAVEKEMDEAIAKCESDLSILDNLPIPNEDKASLKVEYLLNHNLQEVLLKHQRKLEAIELLRKEAEEKKQQKVVVEEVKVEEPKQQLADEDKTARVTLEIIGTYKEIKRLAKFLHDNKIMFTIIGNEEVDD